MNEDTVRVRGETCKKGQKEWETTERERTENVCEKRKKE